MGSRRKISVILLLYFFINFVNGSVEFTIPTNALDRELYEKVLDEQLCAEQIETIATTPMLALYFADAGIRIPKGVLTGNTLDMGNYHQCINFNQSLPNSILQGKHCAIRVPLNQDLDLPELPGLNGLKFDPSKLKFDNQTMKSLQDYHHFQTRMKWYSELTDDDRMAPGSPLQQMQLTLAVCIPKPCTTRQAFDSFLFNASDVGFEYTELYCRLPNDKPWAPANYVAIAVFSCIGLLTLLSTSYDIWHTFYKESDPKTVSVLGKSFSVYANGRRLMTFNSGSDNIECIDGIRALSMAWVVLGHTFTNEVSWSNPLDVNTWSRSWKVLWVNSAEYAVDTFFTLSGFLVVYTTVSKLSGKDLLKNLHVFYLNRLLRMFPLLATVILLEASYLNHMTDGPNWNAPARHVHNCRAAWWTTLLHLQNYLSPDVLCVTQTWYLAIDVQLHILCPIILVWVLWGKNKLAWGALAIGCIGVHTASTIYIFINNFPHAMFVPGRESESFNYLKNYYMNTLTRAGPFLVGMVFGYIVRVSKRRITGLWILTFWTLVLSATTLVVYFNYPMGKPTWDNQFITSFYNSFFRSLWGLAVCCIIYACVNGFAGPINWFLSLQAWKIHSRLSYGIYLFHYMLQIAINNSAVAPFFFSVGLIVFKFLAYYSLSLAVSFLMTLVIDAPFSTLFKLLLGGGGAKNRSKKDNPNTAERPNNSDKEV